MADLAAPNESALRRMNRHARNAPGRFRPGTSACATSTPSTHSDTRSFVAMSAFKYRISVASGQSFVVEVDPDKLDCPRADDATVLKHLETQYLDPHRTGLEAADLAHPQCPQGAARCQWASGGDGGDHSAASSSITICVGRRRVVPVLARHVLHKGRCRMFTMKGARRAKVGSTAWATMKSAMSAREIWAPG